MLGAIVRVLRDSTRTADIHLVSEITSRRRFTALLERESDAALLRERPEIGPGHVDLEHLRQLPPDTLGGAYARHLERFGLDIYLDPTSDAHIADADVRYLVHRYRQTHDIWHALLGLGVQGYEEVLVHAFTLGLLGLPVSGLIVALGSIKHIVLEGRWGVLRHGLRKAYRSGRRSAPLLMVRWEQHWAEPLDQVRRRYSVESLEAMRVPVASAV